MKAPEAIDFETLLDRYAVLLFDAYGVLVHASGAMPGAAARLIQLEQTGKAYFVLTNDASKLPATTAERYRGWGLAIAPERIITAGTLLAPYFRSHGLIGRRCAVLGPEDSRRYVDQAGGALVPFGEDFEVLVVADESGYPFLEGVDTVLTALYRRLDRGASVRLLLPNPDLVYPQGPASFGIASGSIALILEAALRLRYGERPELRFERLGKPEVFLYAEAQRRAGTSSLVMLGDQLETDIRGANACGIDSVLVTSGISRPPLPTTVSGPRPTYWMSAL